MQQFKVKFKNIQLLAPIRQKEKFETLFKELLPEYQVDCTLDEGMAVLFHSINSLISQGNYQKGRVSRLGHRLRGRHHRLNLRKVPD